jgi:hypothetical protein
MGNIQRHTKYIISGTRLLSNKVAAYEEVIKARDKFYKDMGTGIEIIDEYLEFNIIQTPTGTKETELFAVLTICYFLTREK